MDKVTGHTFTYSHFTESIFTVFYREQQCTQAGDLITAATSRNPLAHPNATSSHRHPGPGSPGPSRGTPPTAHRAARTAREPCIAAWRTCSMKPLRRANRETRVAAAVKMRSPRHGSRMLGPLPASGHADGSAIPARYRTRIRTGRQRRIGRRVAGSRQRTHRAWRGGSGGASGIEAHLHARAPSCERSCSKRACVGVAQFTGAIEPTRGVWDAA